MRRTILLLIAACTVTFSQTRLEFEVASIKPATAQIEQVGAGLHIDGAQVSLTGLSIRDIMTMSYRVQPSQISGPDWIASQRYNVVAKLPDGATQDQVPQMLQNLLLDRFQMKMHREMRELPIYALSVAKAGLKMTALPPDPNDNGKPAPISVAAGGNANGVSMQLGNGTSLTLGATSLEAKKMDMQRFTDLLTRFMDRPVVDMTDLKGSYDFMLELTPEDRTAMLVRSALNAGLTLPPQALRILDFGSTASLSSSLSKLGLTLDAKRSPLEVLVIDSVVKTPTEN
ncbi:MAG TPA: TIGR03435 family protein [Terriglobia bacterium]|nr:TIGR03435 family protein [Terriglobia bacterium]